MSNNVKRILGWEVGVPIPLFGSAGDAGGTNGVAYVVCARQSKEYPLSGYRIDDNGNICSMVWSAEGKYRIDDFVRNLDPSYRVLPEPELPLWTMEDSEALLGKVLRLKGSRKVWWISEVADNGVLRSDAIGRPYSFVAENYTHLDGTPIPQRRMPL